MEQSQRQVVMENEILAQKCPECHAPIGKMCRTTSMRVLIHKIDSSEHAFHRQRVGAAYIAQLETKFKHIKSNIFGKGMLAYYAFALMSDSVAAKSKEIMGTEMTSHDVQEFFATKALEECNRDRIFE